MAVTETTLWDGSRGFTIDPEDAADRFTRDIDTQGDDVSGPEDPRAHGNYTYVTTADGRKDRGWDNQTFGRRTRRYVDGETGLNAEGDGPYDGEEHE